MNAQEPMGTARAKAVGDEGLLAGDAKMPSARTLRGLDGLIFFSPTSGRESDHSSPSTSRDMGGTSSEWESR